MSEIIIKAENLGKKYIIGHQTQNGQYVALRDVLVHNARHVWNKTRDVLQGRPIIQGDDFEEVYALRGVSFEIRRGEVLGIIGRNGAGKSTLLKILSRITEPTEGRVRIKGRVASLLEVGTGFHPELSGRENIFLNGAILGMARTEIKRKFDEIVAFADVEKFLDTPVKRYSSGMYIRLAFAVAAHLETEILLIDEVLAVGDSQFQKKCLGRMSQLASSGRTVLLVSHNMTAVSSLCDSAIWLSEGKLVARGQARDLVHNYLSRIASLPPSARLTRRHPGQDVRVGQVELLVDGVSTGHVRAGQSCKIRVHYKFLGTALLSSFSVSIMLFSDGQQLTNLWSNSDPNLCATSGPMPKVGFLDCDIHKWPFRSCRVRVDVYCHTGHATQDWIEEAFAFESYDGDFHGSGIITNPDQGILFLDHSWSFGISDQSFGPAPDLRAFVHPNSR